MKGFVSFHPVDMTFFDDLIAPLAMGRKVNPEEFLVAASRLRRTGWIARRFAVAIEGLAQAAEAPEVDPSLKFWQRVKSNLERIDYRPEEGARRAARGFDPDLHLDGRPFFVAEGSAERVADAVDAYVEATSDETVFAVVQAQLARMDPQLPPLVEPSDIPDLSSDHAYRGDLLAGLKEIHDLARLARDGKVWSPRDAPGRPAIAALPEELPWRAVWIHGRLHPFWIGRDVDGLETICRAAGVQPPDCLGPAWRLFAESCDEFPALRETLGLEVRSAKSVGAFVGPSEIGQLVEFLAAQGARIIGAAARAGEGPMATGLLRKIKECAVFAQRHGRGYLEAGGIVPAERDAG